MLTEEDLLAVTQKILARLPDWLRNDLLSKDPKVRSGAEETMGKIITSAIMDAEFPAAANDIN